MQPGLPQAHVRPRRLCGRADFPAVAETLLQNFDTLTRLSELDPRRATDPAPAARARRRWTPPTRAGPRARRAPRDPGRRPATPRDPARLVRAPPPRARAPARRRPASTIRWAAAASSWSPRARRRAAMARAAEDVLGERIDDGARRRPPRPRRRLRRTRLLLAGHPVPDARGRWPRRTRSRALAAGPRAATTCCSCCSRAAPRRCCPRRWPASRLADKAARHRRS